MFSYLTAAVKVRLTGISQNTGGFIAMWFYLGDCFQMQPNLIQRVAPNGMALLWVCLSPVKRLNVAGCTKNHRRRKHKPMTHCFYDSRRLNLGASLLL